MNDALRLVGRAYLYDQRTFWRMPQAAFFTMLLPVLMLVIFSTLNDGDEIDALETGVARYLLIGMVVFAMTSAAYGSLAARMIWRRETGIDQRFRTTPAPAWSLVAGQVAGAVTVTLATLAVLFTVAVAFFDVAMPTNWPLFGLVVLLGASTCCALGAALATVVRSVEAADPVVFATMLPVVFISGVFQYVPPDSALAQVASIFPVRHLLQATLHAFGLPVGGSPAGHLAVVAAWGLAGGVVAVRRFRWAPSR